MEINDETAVSMGQKGISFKGYVEIELKVILKAFYFNSIENSNQNHIYSVLFPY
ncbi:hypothetical protein [Salegentibacter sp. Hel_I_6]|uniref:hypothetical protein n=1 Tax=Salegentibacter sp. Hel_I_6 TaxID=1250278 RepID=UPI0012E0463F|nr:hypothetical protein [Salegentibacter sp. Hel_I_6]